MFMLKARSRVVDVPGVVWVLTRSLFIVAITLALLVSAGVAYAQGTPTAPTIESVAVTSDPGEDGGYAIGDEIQVGLTFSEAVTVTGAPQLTLDVGGQNRTAEYSEGSTTTQLLFTYTVASGDEDTDGIAVVANSLALNNGTIRAGNANATLTHAALQANDHKVDGVVPTVTVGGETRTYVPPGRQFNVVFYFSEKVYGITDAEITVTNGAAHDVRATSGNAIWPRYTRWDVIIVSAAEGPVTVTLEAGAGADAYGNENTAPGSALSVIAADPVMVEVTRTTSGFAEGGKAAFIVTRSRDNGAIPVSLSLDQTGDFLSGTIEVYPSPDPNNPGEPVVPEEFTFTETPFTLNVTFAAGETSKRIALPTEDDYRDEDNGTVTLSVPAKTDQYKYIPGLASSASADVRDNEVPAAVSLYWTPPTHPYDTSARLDTALEGGSIDLTVYGVARGEPLQVTLAVTEVGSYLDLDGDGAWGYENLGNGKLLVTLPVDLSFQNVIIPLVENDVKEADGSVTITIEPDPERSYTPSVQFGELTVPVKDNDTPSTVSISAPDSITEGGPLSYTLTRTWEPGQGRGELSVNVELAQTGDYITWPAAHQPDADGPVTIPVTFAARSLTATLTLETVDDEVSEDNGSVTATILADADGSYVTGADSAHTARLLDNDPPTISVEAVAAVVTEGANAQYRITRSGNTSGSLRVGLYVTGLPKIMTDATETIVLTSDNEDQSKRLTFNGAWVDSILEFAAGETEKTVSFTTEADSINEGDGWLGVRIVQRVANPFSIGTGYAQVLVKDDDIPTVSLIQPVGPTGLTLSSDGTTWEGTIVEGTQFTYNSTCTGVTEFSDDATVNLDPVSMWVQYSNHPAFYGEPDQNGTLGYNRAGIHHLGTDCSSQTVTYRDYRFYVGPENGVLEIEIVPRSELEKQWGASSRYRPRLFTELAQQYEAAAAEAQAAGTMITKKNIFHPLSLTGYYPHSACNESDLRYCPQYQVGTVNKIRLTITNRDPTILIKAESTSVTEGQTARFILERRWATDLLALPPPQSHTVVYMRASQDGQYITGALPTQITFGQNETRKVIELQTVDDSAFGDSGSVTIELLPDTSTGSENLHGMYSIWANWVGHTPAGGRSDKATVTITDNDDKPGITIAPASATEGDSGNTNMTFTVTLATAVTEAVTVNYATSDSTAIAGQDYTAVSDGSVTIPAGKTTAKFTVSVTGDETDELDETFNVTISLPEPDPGQSDGSGSSPPDVAIVGGNTAVVVGTILDDDPVVVTVAPKADSVVEGQDAVFVLTRTGHTDDALSMQVLLSAPGKVETLSAEFEAGATTTELSVETEDNDLVDYPSARDYTIEALGDGDINDRDDEIYTPGDPSQATVSVTDNDELQIITVYPHEAFVREGGEAKFVFRRTGDTSEELRFTYMREQRQAETTEYLNYYPVSETFPAGLSEVTSGTPVIGSVFPSDQVVNRLYPYKITAQVYGDGHRYGVHRIWKAGNPNTATVVYYDDDRTRDTVLRAEYPGLAQVGQTIKIDFEVLNTGSEATGNSITVSSVQRASGDRNQTKPAEPRAGCSISGSLATGEMGTCRATFTLSAQDLTDSPMVLDATASDGTTTSSTLRIYITVLGGVAVGFNETDRLSVTEPANGAANAQAVLAVTRVGESDEQVQVAYTVEPIHTQNRPYPAEEGADYVDNSATPGILTFAANETEKNITIDILGDEIDEQREQFRVTLVPPKGVLVEDAKRDRTVAIVNSDPPSGESYKPTASLELVSADPTPENAGSVDFAVVLDRVWGEDARFEVELDSHDNLTATPAFSRLGQTGDFEAPDGLIHATIPAGQTRFEFSLTLYDDDVREEDETFQMLLGSSITKYLRLIGDEDEALVTIADDDFVEPTGVELALTSDNGVFDSVAENSSLHDITVTASFSNIRWPTDAADAALRPADPRDVDTTVRVKFDSANSAAAQIDLERFQVANSQGTFQDVESFDIVIPAGQTSGTTTLRFKPANDDLDEEDETVILQGAEVLASDSDEFLPVNSASFTITDDDTRGITVSPASLATGSGIGMKEGGTSTYSLVLDTEPTDTVTVTVASEQDNLIRLTPETFTFTPSNWSTTQTISVVSLDDGTDASFTEAFIAHRVSGGDYGSVSVRNITLIIENTTQAYIYLDDAQASESDGYVEFTVSVRPILRTVPVVVRYTTVDGTAAAGTDYTRQVNTGQTYKIFSIPANGGAATIRIPITDNEVYGPAKKTFTLQLTNQNNKALLDGDATSLTATGSIIDDDPKPVVSVAGPAGDLSYVSEDMKGPVTFTLTLTGRSAADVTVDYATGQAQVLSRLAARQGITPATAGEDYTAATGTVTFSPGDATKQVTVQLTDDDVSEDTEFFGFKISNAKNAQLRNEATEEVADVGLLDDDPRGVAIDPTSISLEEPAPGEAAVASSYTVKLNSKPTDTVTVTIGGANLAVSLSGATLSNTNTLTFTTSNWDTAQTVTVTPVEDANGIAETITLTHIQSGGDYTGIAADSVTVNVTDSDTRNVVLSPTSLTVTEGDDTGVSYTVKLSTQPSDTITVTIGGHSGTDLSISRTTLSNSNTLTFSTSNWSTAQTVMVKAGHDSNSDDESEILAHTASGGDYANLTKDLPVTVTDDAPATVTVSFGSAAYTVAESDDTDTTGVTENTVQVTVTLSADPERTVVIPIKKTNEGGASDSDYSGVPQSVTFDSGDTSKTFTFTAAHDTVDDDGESVKLSFGDTLPDGVTTGATDEATVTITDDDVPSVTVSFGSAAYTVAESDDSDTTNVTENTVEVTLTLSADPERTVVIPIETANEGGATSADYSGVPQNVTFDSGDTSKSFTFTAAHDTDDDDGESVKLSFGATLPDGVTTGTPATSAVTITDDDVPSVTVSFGAASYTVTEGSSRTVTVTLDADPERTVVIPIEAANEGGASDSDYTGVPESVTFDAGDISKSFDVSAVEDNLAESGERVKLSFGTLPADASAGAPSEASVSIHDRTQGQDLPTSPTVHFESTAYSVDEGATVAVKVKLSKAPGSEVVIPITHTPQGATTSADYSGVPSSMTFEATDTEQTITFAADDDEHNDDGESALLAFGVLPGGITVTTGQADEATVSITDDDDPAVTVMFGQVTYTVDESDDTGTTNVTENTVEVTVTLSADPERTVVISIEKTNQGATTADYSGVPQNVTFDSGETSKTFTFTATHDTVDDDGESVKLSFGATLPDGVTTGTPATSAVTITDDDVPSVTVSFGAASYTVTEGSSRTVTVTLDADPERTVVIPIEAANEGGASDSDYTGVPESVTFDAGDISKSFDVSAVEDNLAESGERVKLSFGTLPADASAGAPSEASVSIHDRTQGQDLPTSPTVHFESAAYSVDEGATVAVKVKLSKAPGSEAVIPISITNRAGASDNDYTGVPDSLTFGAADTEKTITFAATDDSVDDDGEKVELSFGSLPGGITATAGEAAEAVVTITDDDKPAALTVEFGQAAYTAAEGGTVTVKVTLSDDPEMDLTIPISKTNQGGATSADYSGVPNSVTFGSGDTSKTFVFTAEADTDDDDGEKVKLSFGTLPTTPVTVTAGTTDEATVTITDDDVPSVTVSFGSAAYTVAESDDSDTTNVTENTVEVTVTLDADPERTVVIPIEKTTQGGATTADYSGVPQNVTFDSGDTSKSFTFTAAHDTVDDDGESVKLSFGTLPTGVTAGTPVTSAVTITDDDVPSVTVSFGSAAYTVAESDDSDTTNVTENTVEVTVTLSADPERTVVIPIEKTNQGDATTADYSGVPQNVTFDSGDTSKSFTFTAAHDTDDDDGESVKLSFGATLPTGVTAGTPATSAVTITDDDVPSVTVSFGSAAYTVAESDDSDTTDVTENTVQVTVTLSADPERTVGIPIEKTNQDGATAADYSGVPQNVTFDSGETSKTFTFTAAHDTVDDDGESVKLGFGATLPDGVSAGTTDEATVTITDDDVPSVTVSFGAASYTVTEGASRTVTVTLSADPERTVVIPIEKTNEGGATTADYSGVPQNVTFDSGESSKSFTFTAAHDTVDDDGESVNLSFGATLPTGVTAGTPATSAVTITDDDVPSVTVSFGSAAYTVAESDDSDTTNVTENTVEVTVTLSADPERTVVIPIEKAHQGGATTADYSGVPQNVTFDSGDTQKSFVFTAETDTDDDHGESVRLSFDTMPDARVSEGSPSEAMVTIRQDSTQSTADCNSAIWCADLEFKSQSLPAEMWVLDDKPLDSEFDFDYNGVTYRFGGLSVDPYGHNIPINSRPNPPFAIPERTKFNLRLLNMNASSYSLDRFRMPNDDWMNWTLHVSTAKDGEMLTAALPLSEGRFSEHYWIWYGSDLEALRAAWMEGQVYKLKIVEDPRSQRTPKVLGPPLYLKVTPYTNHTLGAWWKMPENRVDRAPPNTTYKVQWKEASDSWDNPADVSEETDSPSPATKETLFHSIRGLTGGVEYHVRVVATNTVGDSEPSEVVSGTPTPLPAAGQNIAANSPAKGAPSIEGTPEVGQTLSAVTTDITDDDGLQDVVFSYQWLPDDVEISGADGATYILTSDDLGKAINVRVDFTDNAGNEESLTSAPTAAVTAAEDLDLQSATVDGSALTLTYNEELDTGVTPPASAFAVMVGDATRSLHSVSVSGSAVTLTLATAVESGDTVTVAYTVPTGESANKLQDASGNAVESCSGQAVTNNTASSGTPRTVPPPAPGAPTSLKVARHESGKLLASWNAPDSGPAPTGYTLQWKESVDDWDDADDVSEANVNGTSHVITGLTDGVEYAMRVVAHKGDADGNPSGEVTATPLETVPPSPSAASVDGATLTITFDEPLDAGETPDKSAFVVAVAGSSRGVDTVSVSGSVVTLTVVTAVFAGEVVTVDYTVPADDSAARLQDLAGNAAASFSGQQVTNDTQAAAQLTASVSLVPESHDGSTVFTFGLRFSETPRKRFSYKIMRDLALTVTGGEVIKARRLAPQSNVGWEIHVRPDGNGPITIVLPVTTDCTAEGAICTEDRRPLSNRLEITVPAPGG